MIIVGTTLAAYVMDQPDTWASWMRNAEAITEHAQAVGEDVRFFAAIELDARGLAPFESFIDRLGYIGGGYWTYHLDDERVNVTTLNRLAHLTTGQNLVTMYATNVHADWLLFMAADTMAPDDIIPRMLELDHPLCAPFISTYCLTGPTVTYSAGGVNYTDRGFDVMDAMASAACVMIRRDLFKVLRWRADPDVGMSDDPCYQNDAWELFGFRTHVRRDVLARHFPESIGPIEGRGHDMTVHR